MTIHKGQEWGTIVGSSEVSACIRATTDQQVAAAISGSIVEAGDLATTLGVASPPATAQSWRRLPLDLLQVSLVDRSGTTTDVDSAAWVAFGHPGWGSYTLVANTSFVRGRRVFPRSHPNDGRFEILEVDKSMSFRQRLAALRRIPRDAHFPHPQIHVRTATTFDREWARPLRVIVDGEKWGSACAVSVRIKPDSTFTHIAT